MNAIQAEGYEFTGMEDEAARSISNNPLVVSLLAWVHDAKPNTRYVYHIGLFGYEREDNPALDALGNTVMDLYDAGLIFPSQLRATFAHGPLKGHRKDDNDPRYVYIATRTRKRTDGG